VESAVHAAFLAGGAITEELTQEEGEEKDDKNVGHHAIVTAADLRSQEIILDRLTTDWPYARFITEEKAATRHRDVVLSDQNLDELGKLELVYGVDSLDGTSQFNNQLYEWSISVGVMRRGTHVGGAIYAPMVRGGLLVVGEPGRVSSAEDGGAWEATRVWKSEVKKSVIYVGPDLFFLPQFKDFLYAFSPQVRTTIGVGSCALGMALVAAGRVDALVEPVQCPWDWFAGYPLVEAAGGKVLFYHYRKGYPTVMERPDPPSYSTVHRNTAFIAGNPAIVDWLWELLQEKWVSV
jgi:myo-inositol-1(or 4)-monophosphatase